MRQLSLGVPHRVYGVSASGNCHKVKMALDHLGIPYRWHEVDMMGGETRRPEFLARNPNGKVPVLQIDATTYLAESNAILCYLAEGSTLWPGERLARAQVLQWLFFEQYSHEPQIAVARFIRLFLKQLDHPRLPKLIEGSLQALDVMEQHLARHDFFVGGELSIADLSLFAYTHRADDAGVTLDGHPHVRAWLARCAGQRGVSAMPGPA
jgi:glutathione S-transferase